MTAGALVIAAGFSRRFGADKRRFAMRSGHTLLATTLTVYQRAFRYVAVVVRDSDSALLAELRQSLQDRTPIVVTTAHAARGMSASLADGIRAVGEWDYVFIGLGDMPWVREETLRTLDATMARARRARRPCIVQPFHAGAPGHPVGFSCEYFGELLALTGDEGARTVLRAHSDATLRIDVDDPGVVTDLDQPPS